MLDWWALSEDVYLLDILVLYHAEVEVLVLQEWAFASKLLIHLGSANPMRCERLYYLICYLEVRFWFPVAFDDEQPSID